MLKTDEFRTKALPSLVTPETLANELPISQEIISNITSARQRIEAIPTGELGHDAKSPNGAFV